MRKASYRRWSLVLALALGGCATMPSGPSVAVMPGPGKTFTQFQTDDALCRQWAGQRLGMAGPDDANRNTATGSVVGTVLGAGLGAALGAASGHAGAGAAIGAGTGLLLGTAAGANADQVSGWEAQRRYDIAYEQCMYAKGNQIPGASGRTRRSRRFIPPPPPPDRSYPAPESADPPTGSAYPPPNTPPPAGY